MKLLKQLKNRKLLGGLSLLILISAGYVGVSSFKEYLPPAKIDLLTSGYPRAFFFRRSENLITAGYENWEKTFNRLGGIMGKNLNEEILNRKVTLPFFQKFKQRNPQQAVFLHYNGNARDPLDGSVFYQGHWVYYEGTPLLQDIDDDNNQVTIKVKDASIFKTKTGRAKNRNDDLAICKNKC